MRTSARSVLLNLRWRICARLVFGGALVCSLTSCAVVGHLDEALALKGLSDERDAQARDVEAQDRKFDELLERVLAGDDLKTFHRKADFISHFGAPVLEDKTILEDGEEGRRLLYRRSVQYFNGTRVLVFFDASGELKKVACDARDK